MLQDDVIIDLLIQRDEQALQAISQKYGAHGRELAQRILGSRQEAEECLNDALLRIWMIMGAAAACIAMHCGRCG